ncbi:unnamed protein product [Brachionus calyciflorus]|uniref:Nuclear receptor domain-containing protein n=1 Tax=Brachionus calyciflorus TaxID=104777 RepID=A0A813SI39_9BILA|nr:unnamed protein product [Brachionus calyciflorus]
MDVAKIDSQFRQLAKQCVEKTWFKTLMDYTKCINIQYERDPDLTYKLFTNDKDIIELNIDEFNKEMKYEPPSENVVAPKKRVKYSKKDVKNSKKKVRKSKKNNIDGVCVFCKKYSGLNYKYGVLACGQCKTFFYQNHIRRFRLKCVESYRCKEADIHFECKKCSYEKLVQAGLKISP